MLLASSQFAANQVTVSGASALSQREVLAAADVAKGMPLLRVDLEAIHDQVADLPEVADVTVNRSWPDTVSIVVTEREPLAVVEARSLWWAMDEEGVLFEKTADRSELPRRLPEVAVNPREAADTRRSVAAVVEALPPNILAKVRRVTAQSMDSITLHLNEATTVTWGSSAESAAKAEVLAILLTRSDARLLDVSVPQFPTSSQE